MRPLWLGITAAACIGALACASLRADDAPQNLAEGKRLFLARCGYCHLGGGTGTIMLGRRLGKDKSLLEQRTDLSADYIRHVVRAGIGSMPRHNRIELPDSELDSIANYLTRPSAARDGQR